MNYNGKVVWITGASSGIGEALSHQFAKEKAKLVLSARNQEALNSVKAQCEALGAQCLVLPLDVTDMEAAPLAFAKVIAHFGRVDVLINNSGISQRSLAAETPMDIDRKIMEVNYFGAIALTKAVLPQMLVQQSGHLVAISSVVGKFGFPLRSAYSASKHALHGYYESVRAENQNQGLKVMLVCPGRVKTNISYNALAKDGSKHGVMDDAQAQGISAEDCAHQIIQSMKRNKKEIWIGGKEVLMVYIRKYLPFLFYKLAAKVKAT